jgi:hypothetical protein
MNPEYRLDPASTLDIFDVYSTVAACRVARDIFVNMILQCPPTVTLKSSPGNISRELEMLLEHQYREWAEALYDNLKMFGICPYYFEAVPGTIHKFPVVPVFGSGYIVTLLTEKGKQEFKWYQRLSSFL